MRKRQHARAEDEIQRTVFAHLRARAAPGVFAFHVPMGGKRRPVEAAILKGMGATAGVPDIIIIKNGQTLGLELKTEMGRATENQRRTIEAMRAAGADCEVCYGLNAALKWLEDRKVLLGKAI